MNKEYFEIKKNNEMIYTNKLNYINEVDNKIDKDYILNRIGDKIEE